MVVRPAEPSDADAIASIYAHYVEHSAATFDESPPDIGAIAERIGASELPYLVAEDGGEIRGYAYLAPYRPRSAYRYTAENSVYVHPAARRRGIGRTLLDELLAEGEELGLREVVAVITATDGDASVALHSTCGFREMGRLERVGFKHGRWHDTLLMQRSLGRG